MLSAIGSSVGSTKEGFFGQDVLAKHASTKHHTWRGAYKRVWALTATSVQHGDESFSVTNTWPYTDIVEAVPAVSSTTDFSFTVRTGKGKTEVMKFSSDARSALLCDLQRLSTGDASSRRFVAVKVTRAAARAECVLELGSWFVGVLGPDSRRTSLYPFREITSVKLLRDDPSAFVIYAHGRPRLYATPERAEFLRLLGAALLKVGLGGVAVEGAATTSLEYRAERLAHGADGAPRIADWDVLKITPKHPTPRPRKLVFTESSLVERDGATYGVVGARPWASLFALVRAWDDPQKLTLEWRDGSSRSYLCPARDALLGSALDAARNAGNGGVLVSAEATKPGDRMVPLSAEEDADAESAYIEGMRRAAKAGGASSSGPYNVALVRAATEFVVNASPGGVGYTSLKKSAAAGVVPDLAFAAAGLLSIESIPAALPIALLNALDRLAGSSAGYKAVVACPETPGLLLGAIRSEDDGIVFAGLELLRRLAHNPRRPTDADEDAEAAAKKLLLSGPAGADLRVAIIQSLDVHAGGGGGGGGSNSKSSAPGRTGFEGTLVVLSLTSLLDSLLVTHVDTTPVDAGEHLTQLVASRYVSLLSLFRCNCPGVVEAAALLVRCVVEQADLGTCRAMQAAALSSGVWLRHFHNAVFAPTLDQRYVSRYLVELWSVGNVTAREVLRHVLPAGLLLYLDMPKLSATESAHLESVEAAMEAATSGGGRSSSAGTAAAAAAPPKSSVARRLRTRLEGAERASHNRVRRRLNALEEGAAGARRGSRKNEPAAAANMASAAAAAVAAAAAMHKAKMEGADGKTDNYSVFFFQLLQDHVLPDLIWSSQTRGELRSALDAELREVEREIELGGGSSNSGGGGGGGGQNIANITNITRGRASSSAATAADAAAAAAAAVAAGASAAAAAAVATAAAPSSHVVTGGTVDVTLRVAWNFSEFEVEYPSLVQELRVGDYYLRLFLESGEASVATLREPGRFFDALYRRVLRESAPHLKCMCLRGMTRVYERHASAIGAFDDTDYMVYLLSTASHAEVRDRLLLLLRALSAELLNCEKMLNPDCLELLVDLLTTAHTTDTEQRAGPTLKGGANLLLLTNAGGGGGDGDGAPPPESAPPSNPKESMKVWHYRAGKGELAPGENPQKGPYSLQDLQRLGDMKLLGPATLVWAQGMREWVRLDSLRALQWYTLSEGLPALTPHARGEVCCELLRRLVALRPSVDAEGVPVRPVPRAKRVLCGPRTLPHIAQALLAGSPALVDAAGGLLSELVAHNPKAVVKLYTTGVYFFALGYGGSNWGALARLLGDTHLSQSFHADAASLTSETTLGKRSILGVMLPESLLCVLENKGPGAFADTFLANLDTPEVIWKFSMRAHLGEMVAQHLGDLPSRLAANPCTLYDYCPIPPVRYEELDAELWCSNFYLHNLCDEARFPDWPIEDPVGLLRAVLDAWRKEVGKGKDGGGGDKGMTTSEEAFGLLGLAAGAEEKDIRKAYRRLALQFHPDKNPAGREMFEKVNKAYEMLTAARGPEAAVGPDPVSMLLMVRTQAILFARHSKVLRAYKYAGYPLLLGSLTLSGDDVLGGERAGALEASAKLLYLTCLASPRNAEELVREGGTEVLLALLARLVPVACVNPPLSPESPIMRLLDHTLHTISGLATLKDARERAAGIPSFPAHLCACLMLSSAPRVLQHALDAISRLCPSAALQEGLVRAGAVFRLLPLLFRYDATAEAAQDAANASSGSGGAPSPSGRATPSTPSSSSNPQLGPSGPLADNANEQRSANIAAKLAVRALARLGGYYTEPEAATPPHGGVRRGLAALLTPPLAKRLSRPSPDALLRVLNGHEESAAVIWNAPMRKELLGFVGGQLDGVNRTGAADMGPASSFAFTALKEELRAGGVYVRVYVSEPSGVQLEDPAGLVLALLTHIACSTAGGAAPPPPPSPAEASGEEGPPYAYGAASPAVAMRHLRLALRALHLVLVNAPGAEAVLANEATGLPLLPALFGLLERAPTDATAADGGDDGVSTHAGAGASGNKAAAGSGASAGAGGARSTPAPPTAGLRELVLTAIAAFAPFEACAAGIARLALLPPLLRLLPRDSGSFGPILRTLFAHGAVIAEVARIGAVIDLTLLFAGGPAAGPPPGRPGGPAPGASPSYSVPKPARAAAAALLSIMASDGLHGPPVFMALSQLLPDALATAIKESVSGATGAGGGASSGLMGGVGVGAAGAGGGAGAGGDVVSAFDSDHETPELIWNGITRHELRSALGELFNGLTGLRRRAASAPGGAPSGPHGPDGVGWSLPPTFRVRYSPHEGELRVGGVYVRLFLKEPTFPLKDPTGFAEALLRRFVQEGDTLCGLTSEDAEKARAAAAQAAAAARAEEAAGGVAVKAGRAGGADAAGFTGEAQLVLRGEDVLTQVTHGLVCLLRVRPALAEHVAALGYISKLVGLLSASTGKPARYNLGVQAVRVLQVTAGSKACVAAAGRVNAVSALLRSLGPPLPRDAAFTLEALKAMLETDSADAHALVEAALRVDLMGLLVRLLEGGDKALEGLVDPSAAKVHAVAILKILEADAVHGPGAAAALQAQHRDSWEKYRHQKHDLFLSRNDTRDYFLTDVATASPAMMLKNEGEWGGSSAAATAGGAGARVTPPSAAGQPAYQQQSSGQQGSQFGGGGPLGGASSGRPVGNGSSDGGPPPAPEFMPERTMKFGGFQAPAPAPVPVASSAPPPPPLPVVSTPVLGAAFGQQQQQQLRPAAAAAPAPVFFAPSAPVPVLGAAFGAPAPLVAATAAAAAGGLDIFSGLSTAPAAAPAPQKAPSPADPFGDLLG